MSSVASVEMRLYVSKTEFIEAGISAGVGFHTGNREKHDPGEEPDGKEHDSH